MSNVTVDFAFLADYGEVANKIYAQGIGIDAIMARKVPVRHPQLFMVAQLRAPQNMRQQSLELTITDPNGDEMVRNVGNMTFSPPAFGDQAIARFSMGFYNLEFKDFGAYHMVLKVGGHELIKLPLHMLEVGKKPETRILAGAGASSKK